MLQDYSTGIEFTREDTMRLFVFILALILVAPCLAERGTVAPERPIKMAAGTSTAIIPSLTISIDPSNICTIATDIGYTEKIYIGDANYHSIGMTIDTTEAVSVIIECQGYITDIDGTETWQSFDPVVSKTVTADYDSCWALSPAVTGVVRFKFSVDTATPGSAYEVERFRLKRK